MNNSRQYLKDLSPADRHELARKVGVHEQYLYQIGINARTPSRELQFKLEVATELRVKGVDFDKELRSSMDLRSA